MIFSLNSKFRRIKVNQPKVHRKRALKTCFIVTILSLCIQPVPEDKLSAADAPSPTPEMKNTEPKEAGKSVDKENSSLESPTAQKRSAVDSSEKSEEARSPPKKMLLEKYNEENATVENSTPEVVDTTEKMGQV